MIKIHKFKNVSELDNYLHLLLTKNPFQYKDILISGGTTFRSTFRSLLNSKKDLSEINFYLTDDRLVSQDLNESNYKWLNDNFFSKKNIYNNDLLVTNNEITMKHSKLVKKIESKFKNKKFDLGIIGVGNDGHIASIFDIVDVKVRSKKFMIVKRKNEKFFRLTHTLTSLLSLPRVIFVFRGSKKSEMFYSSILSLNKNPIKYKNIGPIKKFIKLYNHELVIITN